MDYYKYIKPLCLIDSINDEQCKRTSYNEITCGENIYRIINYSVEEGSFLNKKTVYYCNVKNKKTFNEGNGKSSHSIKSACEIAGDCIRFKFKY